MSSFQTEHHAALLERMFRRAFLRARAGLKGTLALIALWRRRAAARRELKALCELDDSLLRDIGVTRADEDARSNRRPIDLIDSPANQRSQISDR